MISEIPKPHELLSRYYKVLTQEIVALEERERTLCELSDQEAGLAKEVQASYLQGVSLKSKLERAQQRYDDVFRRLQEISLASDYAGFQSDLISRPIAAEESIWPSKAKIGALGLVSSLMLGLGLAIVAELNDKTFRNQRDVENAAGAGVLVHIPEIVNHKFKGSPKASKIDHSVTAYHAPEAVETELFRILRTSVLRSVQRDDKQVFLMTSPSPGDGKSTTIASLAVSIAQSGKRVLLVDADLRRPKIHQLFDVEGKRGLADYLSNSYTHDDCIHPSEQENLSICGVGKIVSNPAELLASEKLEQFVKVCRERFDIILIDTSPLLAVSDTTSIANYADACLLMIRIERISRDMLSHACDSLRTHGIALLGVIVNSPRMGRRTMFYGGYNVSQNTEFAYLQGYQKYEAAAKKKGRLRRSKTSLRIRDINVGAIQESQP